MSNYYKSKCCGEQVEIVALDTVRGVYVCQGCKKECEVTAVIDTPGGVLEATTANANANEISSKLAVDKTEQIREEFEKFIAPETYDVYQGMTDRQVDMISRWWLSKLSEQRQSILEEVEKLSESKGCIGYSPTMDLRGVCCPRHLGHKDVLDTVITIIKKCTP